MGKPDITPSRHIARKASERFVKNTLAERDHRDLFKEVFELGSDILNQYGRVTRTEKLDHGKWEEKVTTPISAFSPSLGDDLKMYLIGGFSEGNLAYLKVVGELVNSHGRWDPNSSTPLIDHWDIFSLPRDEILKEIDEYRKKRLKSPKGVKQLKREIKLLEALKERYNSEAAKMAKNEPETPRRSPRRRVGTATV